jgi:hypothetical protein
LSGALASALHFLEAAFLRGAIASNHHYEFLLKRKPPTPVRRHRVRDFFHTSSSLAKLPGTFPSEAHVKLEMARLILFQ